jgi:hypothetical protein
MDFAFRRDAQVPIGAEFIGFGTTMNTSGEAAVRQAKAVVLKRVDTDGRSPHRVSCAPA